LCGPSLPCVPMAHDCPDCGTPVDLTERIVKVQVGVCPACQRSFSLIPHLPKTPVDGSSPVPGEAGAPAPEGIEEMAPMAEDDDEEESEAGTKDEEEADDNTPVCGTCGASLTFRAVDETTLEVVCAKCDETTRFKAEGIAAEETEERPRRNRSPPREFEREPRGGGGRDFGDSDRRGGGDRGPGGDRPPTRGCRRCGGQIDFEPLPDGGKAGVCRNCGNRFTLPPKRDDFGGGDRRGGRSYGGGGGNRYGGGGGGGRSYPPRGGRRFDRR
jgi:DNA-directed RNA polymerase subunit RPC12/RpoP